MRERENKALLTALALYAGIEADYLEALSQTGIQLAPYDADRSIARGLRSWLAARGAKIRNGGASVSVGNLSQACVACTRDCVSQTFEISNKCHRDCYFCFNRNQENYEYYCDHLFPWSEQLDALAAKNNEVACIALTGGEPLLMPEETYAFFQQTRQLFPEAHLRLYTSGDLLDVEALTRLRDCGLDEIRFSIKMDDTPARQQQVLGIMASACDILPAVVVEMPVIPGTTAHMKQLLQAFDKRGVQSINLLEFTYPMWNWSAFESRGFTLKNPPFPVLYDYSYAGSLAVQGSEELCLELMLWALDENFDMGLHYCSLENKHRSEIRQINAPYAQVHPCYTFDEEDFFLKAAKVFGDDCGLVKKILQQDGCQNFLYDKEDESLTFPLKYLSLVKFFETKKIIPLISYNVAIKKDNVITFRELKLEPFQE